MSRIEFEVLKPGAALEEFRNFWRSRKSGTASAPRIVFGSLRELFSAITEKRLELVRFIADHEGLNTRQVALQLGRDYKNIYVDVNELVELGLLDKDSGGGLSAPFDEIVIHASLRDAA